MTVDDPAARPDSAPTRRRRRRVRRGPILVVVALAVAAAVVAQQEAPSADRAASAGTPTARAVASVPPADVVSSAWYCAAGTSSPDGETTETIVVASTAHTSVTATVTVMPGGEAEPATHTVKLAPGEEVSVPVADVLETPEPGVVVEIAGGPAVVSHVLTHADDVATETCTRTAARDWYFASGTTVDGSRQELALFNPFGDDAIVDIGFVTDTGAQEPSGLQALVVPRRSRVTVPVQDSVLRQERVAVHVHARSGRVVAEQVQIFDDVTINGQTRQGIALSTGARSPATVWRVATGTTRDGGRATLSLANFGVDDAAVAVRVVLTSGQKLAPQTVRVPALGVVPVDVTARVPLDTDFAVVATSRADDGRTVPVVAELLASWPPTSASTGLASTVGTTGTAARWVVATPDIAADSTVTVFNPGPDPVTAEVLPAELVDRRVGATSEPERAVPPGAARTVRLALVASRPAPVVVSARHPVVVGLTVLGDAGAAFATAVPDLDPGA